MLRFSWKWRRRSPIKIERWHKSLKEECVRPGTPLSLEDARHLVERYVEHYNDVGLNSAIGYITPKDMLAGRQKEIHAERDRKLDEARKLRQARRHQSQYQMESDGVVTPEVRVTH
jgi:putative transposase